MWAKAYIGGRFESAYEHAFASAEQATEFGHKYMLICALEARLLAGSRSAGKPHNRNSGR